MRGEPREEFLRKAREIIRAVLGAEKRKKE